MSARILICSLFSGLAISPPLSIARVVMLERNTGQEYTTITRSRLSYIARESLEEKQNEFKGQQIVTEILPAKTFYGAKEYHQQYLEKGGGRGNKQSAAKGC